MIKETLSKTQPVIYRELMHALENQTLMHALLLCGDNDQLLLDTATFIASSLFCERGAVACETCIMCQRVQNRTVADFIVLDCSKDSLKKEMVENLQEQFNKTSLEKNGSKVYIIHHIENASESSLNSLLKFIEEPSENTTAIFTTNNTKQVLPTILSRCEIMQFRPSNKKEVIETLIQKGLDANDAYILAHLGYSTNNGYDLAESEEFQVAITAFKRFLNDFPNKLNSFLVFYHAECGLKEKKSELDVARLFMDMCALFFKDIKLNEMMINGWYRDALFRMDKSLPIAKLILIFLTQRDKCNKYNNLKLIMDQTIYEVKEALK